MHDWLVYCSLTVFVTLVMLPLVHCSHSPGSDTFAFATKKESGQPFPIELGTYGENSPKANKTRQQFHVTSCMIRNLWCQESNIPLKKVVCCASWQKNGVDRPYCTNLAQIRVILFCTFLEKEAFMPKSKASTLVKESARFQILIASYTVLCANILSLFCSNSNFMMYCSMATHPIAKKRLLPRRQ